MLVQKTMLVIALMLCLSASKCVILPEEPIPTVADEPQCTPYFVYKQFVSDELTFQYIDTEESKCFCRLYHFGMDGIGAKEKAKEFPIGRCDRLIGWEPVPYTRVQNYWVLVLRYIAKVKTKLDKMLQ